MNFVECIVDSTVALPMGQHEQTSGSFRSLTFLRKSRQGMSSGLTVIGL